MFFFFTFWGVVIAISNAGKGDPGAEATLEAKEERDADLTQGRLCFSSGASMGTCGVGFVSAPGLASRPSFLCRRSSRMWAGNNECMWECDYIEVTRSRVSRSLSVVPTDAGGRPAIPGVSGRRVAGNGVSKRLLSSSMTRRAWQMRCCSSACAGSARSQGSEGSAPCASRRSSGSSLVSFISWIFLGY